MTPAQLVKRACHVLRLCPCCSRWGFDSALWPFAACQPLSLFSICCQIPQRKKHRDNAQMYYLWKKCLITYFCQFQISKMYQIVFIFCTVYLGLFRYLFGALTSYSDSLTNFRDNRCATKYH